LTLVTPKSGSRCLVDPPSHQIPEMAYFGLADAVDAAEALLDAIGGSTAGHRSPANVRAGG
jgi:hypothetical protein